MVEPAMVLIACAVVTTAALLVAIVTKATRPSMMMFCLYFLAILVVPGIFHTLENQFPFHRKFYAAETLWTSANIVLLFVMIALVTYAFSQPNRRLAPANPPEFVLRWRFLFLITLAAAVVTLAAVSRVGLSAMLSTRAEFQLSARLSDFEVILFVASSRMLAFCALTYAGLVLLRAMKSPLAWLLFAVNVGIFLLADYPLGLPRFYSLGFLLAWFTMAGGLVSRRGRTAVIVGSVLMVSVVLPFMTIVTRGSNTEVGWSHYFESGDFDSFQSVNNVVQYVSQNGPTLGQQAVSTALFFVPRFMWPDKAEATGTVAARFANYTFLNISAPLPAELYMDFHWPGVLLGAMLVGFAMRRFDEWVAANWTTDPRAKLWAAVVTGFTFIVLRGSLLAIAAPIAYVVFTIWLITKFGVRQKPMAASSLPAISAQSPRTYPG